MISPVGGCREYPAAGLSQQDKIFNRVSQGRGWVWYNDCKAGIIPAPVRVEQSETNTLANRAHPLEGYRGFGEVMV